MSTPSNLMKGALVTSQSGGAQSTIPFQYNPETLRRTLQPALTGGQQNDRSQMVRFYGAPIETISVEVELDYVDASGVANAALPSQGVYPLLSALEILIYPPSSTVQSNAQLLSSGTLEVSPSPAPLTLFVWGQQRVVPVVIQSYTITEQAFDNSLTPIRASVALEMRVLSYSDLATSNPGYSQYMVYQKNKETMAGQMSSSPV
ncbi:MAG TPA: hypothetical protein VFQ39_05355 [Longimicrobium sp.]|nr:hypothetical protein [Longimicrobium sp.]